MRMIAWLGILLAAFSRLASADVWMADEKTLYKLDAAGNHVAVSIPASDTEALAVDPNDGSVWILSGKKLTKRSASGALLFAADLKALGLEDDSTMALDGRDGSLWIGSAKGSGHGDDSKSLIRLDRGGDRAGSLLLRDDDVRSISVALDQSVWILGKKRLFHHSRAGTLLADIDLKPLVQGEPKLFLVDSIGAWLWVAAEGRLVRLDADAPATQPVSVKLPSSSRGIASDELQGTIWVQTEKQLLAIGTSGALIRAIDLSAVGIKDAKALAFDPATRSLLVGHKSGLTRLSQSGANPILIATPKAVEAIGVSPVVLETTLALVSPQDGALTRNSTPTIVFQLGALCSGADCGFAPGYFQGFGISATLNGQQVGSSFTIDAASGRATYLPVVALPDGPVALQAFATDTFGQASDEISATFTVDTTPPAFIALTPASPYSTSQTSVHVSGRLSEAGTLKAGSVTVPVASDHTFAFDRPLAPGGNTIVLEATDLAGNTASQAIAITVTTVTGPQFLSLSVEDGAAFGASELVITGTVDPGVTVVLTGAGTPKFGQGPNFSFAVILAPGLNALVLTALDAAGNSSRKPLNLTLVPVTIDVSSPASGTSVQAESVELVGTFTGPPGTRVLLNDVDATGPNGTFDAFVPLAIGVNFITVIAQSTDGGVASAFVQVFRTVAEGPPTINFYSPAEGDTFLAPADIFVGAIAIRTNGRPDGSLLVTNDATGLIARTGEGGDVQTIWSGVPAGTYTLIATTKDRNTGAVTATRSVTITVLPDPADAPFIDAWNGMNAALRAGDKATALTFLNDGAKAKYGPVFDALMTNMPEIIDSYSPLQRVSVDGDVAEFVLGRTVDGVVRVYLIYFLKNADGTWLIDSM